MTLDTTLCPSVGSRGANDLSGQVSFLGKSSSQILWREADSTVAVDSQLRRRNEIRPDTTYVETLGGMLIQAHGDSTVDVGLNHAIIE